MVTPKRLSTSPKRCRRFNCFNVIALTLVVAAFTLVNHWSLNDIGAIDNSVEVKTSSLRRSESSNRNTDRVSSVPALQHEVVVQPEIQEEVKEAENVKPVQHQPTAAIHINNQSSDSVGIAPKSAGNKAPAPEKSNKFEFISKLAYDFTAGEKIFNNTAHSLQPVTDKVGGGEDGHNYEIMYGQFLLPFYHAKPNMKFLEIGLGCDMVYGPGTSSALWKKLFPMADLWMADFNSTCVDRAKANGMLNGVSTITGDQMKVEDLDRWIKESGGAEFVSPFDQSNFFFLCAVFMYPHNYACCIGCCYRRRRTWSVSSLDLFQEALATTQTRRVIFYRRLKSVSRFRQLQYIRHTFMSQINKCT